MLLGLLLIAFLAYGSFKSFEDGHILTGFLFGLLPGLVLITYSLVAVAYLWPVVAGLVTGYFLGPVCGVIVWGVLTITRVMLAARNSDTKGIGKKHEEDAKPATQD
jgi:hypothetical protein